MLSNYLTTALRHLLKQRAYALLNVLGLAVGMTCCLLVILDIQYELTYDAFHTRAEVVLPRAPQLCIDRSLEPARLAHEDL